METAAAAAACEIARLPEELLSAAISRTSPRDACRAAALSPPRRRALPGLPRRRRLGRRLVRLPAPRPPADRRRRALPLAAVEEGVIPSPPRLRPPRPPPGRAHEYVAAQGDRRQVLHAAGEGAAYFVGRYTEVLALDPPHRFYVHSLFPIPVQIYTNDVGSQLMISSFNSQLYLVGWKMNLPSELGPS